MTLVAAALAVGLLVTMLRHSRHRAVWALLAVAAILGLTTALGAPAIAQDDECAAAPMPEVPGAGMVGTFDPPQGQGEAGTAYREYGYAGMVWHTYDTDCGPLDIGVTSPTITLDTWLGNQLFDIAKALVAVTNGLHYTLMDGGLLSGFTDQIRQVAENVFGTVFTQLVSLVLLLLAIRLLVLAWRGALAAVSRRGLITLGALGVAASAPALVASYPVVDDLIVTTTTGVQAGVIDLDNGRNVRDALPTTLHTTVVHQSWLRGEFGSLEHPKVGEYGEDLLGAQAFTWDETVDHKNTDPTAIQAKQNEYKKIAGKLGSATGYFTGEEGSRTGTGFLALLQALAYTIFPLLAKLGVLLAQLLLRILTLAAPLIGLAALVYPDTLRKIGKALGAVVVTVLILAILAGIHTRFLQIILSPDAELSLLIQIVLALLITVTFLAVGKPIRRISQMLTLSAQAGRINTRQDRYQSASQESGHQQDIGAQLTGAPVDVDSSQSSQPRPEAVNDSKHMTAARHDARPAIMGGSPPALASSEIDDETDGGRDPLLYRQDDGLPPIDRLPMEMQTVRRVADEYGIEVDDLGFRLRKKRDGIDGVTDSRGIVHLYRRAFRHGEAWLARTLFHERVHVEELRNGRPYPRTAEEAEEFETRAYAREDEWWESHPLNPGNQRSAT